ncbi:MAG: EamA family transporter [Chlorobiota bacterium]|nr:MAG: EamA family transporter [Chlorobiota bacterium]
MFHFKKVNFINSNFRDEIKGEMISFASAITERIMKNRIKTDSRLFSWLTLGLLAIIWGSSFILMKRGLEAYSAAEVGALRVVISAVVLLPLALRSYKEYLQKYWKHFLFFAVLTNLGPSILFATAQTRISSSLAGVLNGMTPIFTFSIGVLFFSAPFKVNQAVGLVIELGEINYFAFFVVLATIFYGLGSNFLSKHFKGIHPVALTSLAFMTVLPVALVVLLSSGFIYTVATHPKALSSFGYIAILAVVGTAMSLILFNRMIQKTSPVFASTVTYLIPIVAVIWGFIDGEALSIWHFVGMALVISGVYFINMKRS